MDIVDRVKKICLTPAAEWTVIAGESASAGTLMTGYVIPLAGLSAVAGFVGGSVIGHTCPSLAAPTACRSRRGSAWRSSPS